MIKNLDNLEAGTPITHYSAGLDSSIREVTPGKIGTLANELAVIADERTRGVEPVSPSSTVPNPNKHSDPRSQGIRN